MSAISGYISTIQNAVYGEQVRTAIINALLACYSDVENPDLQSAAFQTAIKNAYEDGILDITTVTSFNNMTNQNIIYRYNGTAAGKQKGLYYYSALSNSWVLIGSEIQKVSLLSQMTDVNDIYKYIGTESGMVQNSLYCHNGTSWVPIGSGLLTASTAAQMTNTEAIYKYTGTQDGYITNALYYHNGTAWVPVSPVPDSSLTLENPANAKSVGGILGATENERESGGFKSTDGSTLSNVKFRRTKTFLDPNCVFVSCSSADIKFSVYVYNSSSQNSFVGIWNGSEITATSYYFSGISGAAIIPIYNINRNYIVKVHYTRLDNADMSASDDNYVEFKRVGVTPQQDDFYGAIANLLFSAVYTADLSHFKQTLTKMYPIYISSLGAENPTVELANNQVYNPSVFGIIKYPSDATENITYSSSNANVLYFNSDGNAVVIAEGTVTITASSKFATKTVSVTVGDTGPFLLPSSWAFNRAIYTQQTDRPFTDIQADLDARMLLTALQPIAAGQSYTLTTANNKRIWAFMIDASGIYKQMFGGTASSVTFTVPSGITQLSVLVETASTATEADVATANVTLTANS